MARLVPPRRRRPPRVVATPAAPSWKLLLTLPLAATVARAQSISGAFDVCGETDVNWTEVQASVAHRVQGGPTDADPHFLWVQALANRGLPETSDCWLGWVYLRFSQLIGASFEDQAELLNGGSLEFEWRLWLSPPLRESLTSRWELPALLSAATDGLRAAGLSIGENAEEGLKAGCSDPDLRFLGLLRSQVDRTELVSSAAAALLRLTAAAEASALAQAPVPMPAADAAADDSAAEAAAAVPPEPLCSLHAKVAALLVLGTDTSSSFHVTPGYALRMAQDLLHKTVSLGLGPFLLSPWPLSSLLGDLRTSLLAAGARPAEATEDDLAAAVVEASRREFPGVSPSFLPPASRSERLRLLEGLQVLHAVLGKAQVAYVAMTGTLLGAVRHHGFVPWDGDADVCIDIKDEPRLLRLALLQRRDGVAHDDGLARAAGVDAALRGAAALLSDAGFEVFAHADRPLTYKLSGRSFPRVPGRPYGYPYVDLWFCHGWASGRFSMQSEHFGVPVPREFVFPRRKIFFAGLALWAFGDPWHALDAYYGPGWFEECVGHATFHRQERKYSEEKELERFNGRMPCSEVSHLFSLATAAVQGLPSELASGSSWVLERLRAWLAVAGPVRWQPSLDGGDAVKAPGRPEPIEFGGIGSGSEVLVPSEILNATTSSLRGPGSKLVHHLSDVRLAMAGGIRCDALLRFTPLPADLDTQLVAAFAPSSGLRHAGALTPLSDADDGRGEPLRLEVVSCVCRRRLGPLILEWVAEDP